MNLTEELKHMKKKGMHVVGIDYILRNLKELEEAKKEVNE